MKNNIMDILLVIAISICLVSSSVIIYTSRDLGRLIQEKQKIEPKVTEAQISICVDKPIPVLDSIEDQNMTAGDYFTYDVNATSPSSDTIYYYDDTELFDINHTSGLISFTPTEDNVGVHVVTVSARHDICEGSGDNEIVNFIIYSAIVPSPPAAEEVPAGGGGAVFCKENWSCGKWGDCKFYLNSEIKEVILELCEKQGIEKEKCGFQERTCIDTKNCGTTREKPSTIKICLYTLPPPEPSIPPAIPPRVPMKCGDKFCEFNELFTCIKDCWPIWLIFFIILSTFTYFILRKKVATLLQPKLSRKIKR